jgi:hypothetical protein
MSEVSFGVFDWIDRGTQPLSQLYEDRLQLLAAADEGSLIRSQITSQVASPAAQSSAA